GAFENRADAAQGEGVDARLLLVVTEEAAVKLHIAAQLQKKSAIGGLDRKSVLPRSDRRRRLRLVGFRLLAQLVLALQDTDFLIQLLDLFVRCFLLLVLGAQRASDRSTSAPSATADNSLLISNLPPLLESG